MPVDPALASLVADLASPDPQVRDERALTALSGLVDAGLSPTDARWLGEAMVARLTHPEPQARSFAPLVLAALARVGVVEQPWVAATCAWYAAEPDLRGHDPRLGWVHAAAHGADALGAFGRSGLTAPGPLLDALARRLVAATDTVFRDQEDDRIAHAAALVLADPRLGAGDAVGWLAPVAALLADGEPGPVPGHVSNALRTLRSLSLALEHEVLDDGGQPLVVAHAVAVRAAVADALRPPTAWLWR